MKTNTKILVLCTGNSCRSQIAEAYIRHFAPKNCDVYSAGIETHGVNPRAVSTLLEDGIDASNHTSNHVDDYADVAFDYVLTVCDHAQERCPIFPSNAIKLHCNFTDPAKAIGTEEDIQKQFRDVRNQIKEYCKQFVEKNLL